MAVAVVGVGLGGVADWGHGAREVLFRVNLHPQPAEPLSDCRLHLLHV